VRRAPAGAGPNLESHLIFYASEPAKLLRLVFDTAALRDSIARLVNHFSGWFTLPRRVVRQQSMKPIQGYHLVKPEDLFWRRPNLANALEVKV